MDKKTATPTSADPIAAIVSIVVMMLSALQIPEALHMTAAQVTGIGSAVVLVAGAGRAIWHWRRGEVVNLQDPIAAALGGIVLTASIFGLPNAAEIDGSTIAMIASAITGALSIWRTNQERPTP